MRGLVVLLVCALAGGAAVAEDALSPEQQLAALGWLEGTWEGPSSGGRTWSARYTSPRGGEILSTNKELSGDRVVSFEFERFHVRDGRVVLTPYVRGKQSVSFTLTAFDALARVAVFENLAHDFPQRIAYQTRGRYRLHIAVSAKKGSRPVGFVLDLARPDRPAEGAETVEAVVARLLAAVRANDRAEIAACVAPADRVALLMLVVVPFADAFRQAADVDARLQKMRPGFVALARKFGLESALREAARWPGTEAPPGGWGPWWKERLRDVDADAAAVEFGELAKRYFPNPAGIENAFALRKGPFRDVRVEGDQASGRFGAETVRFTRVRGRWYFVLAEPLAGSGR